MGCRIEMGIVGACMVALCGACTVERNSSPWDVTPTTLGDGAGTDSGVGDDDGETGDATGTGDSDGSGVGSNGANTGAMTTSDPPDTSTSGGLPPADGSTGGDGVLEACLDVAQNACEQCACNSCLDPLYACQMDPGCVAMRDCAEQAGCVGVDCYEPCQGVIDDNGGPFGDSANRAVALSDCLEGACPACF